MRRILPILVVALLFGQTSALAETKEIIAEGTYNMGDGETPTVAESRALLQANEWFEKGRQHHLNKKYDEAFEAYTLAIVLNPNYASAYNNRGIIYGNKGQYERAIEDFSKAIVLNPNHAAAYTERGIAYKTKGQYDRAEFDFRKACDLGG